MSLQQYWPAHFVVEGQILKINPEILTVVSGGSFINPITVTVADAASAGLNTLATLTARRASPGAGFGESILFRLDDSLNVIANAAAMDALWESATSGFVSSALAWRNQSLGGGLAEKMRLTSKGTLALGTSTPNASAIFQADSTTRGVLDPRLTSTQRNAVASPLEGLRVWNSTTKKISIYNGTAWEDVGVTGLGAGDEAHFGIEPSSGTTFGTAGVYFRYNLALYGRNEANNASVPILSWDLSTATGHHIVIGGTTNNEKLDYKVAIRANGGIHSWYAGTNRFMALEDQRLIVQAPAIFYDGVSDPDPDPSAIVDLNTITKGLLLPRLTTTQRTGVSSPADGLILYDGTLNKTYVRAGGACVFIGDNPLNIGVSRGITNYLGGTKVTDVETIAGNVIADPNKSLHLVDSTADRAITLPSAAPVYGIHLFLDITHSAATHPSTFDVQSSGTIDGNSTAVVSDNRYFRSFIKIATSQWVFAG